jgi:hypothetical protein
VFNPLARTNHPQRAAAAGHGTILSANTENGRRVTVRLSPSPTISIAEIEVLGALLAQLETIAVNDNAPGSIA